MSDSQLLAQSEQLRLEVHRLAEMIAAQKQDSLRYEYLINCDYLAAKKYIPLLDEDSYKSMLRCKHDKAMDQRS
jgi:hypothetical protein